MNELDNEIIDVVDSLFIRELCAETGKIITSKFLSNKINQKNNLNSSEEYIVHIHKYITQIITVLSQINSNQIDIFDETVDTSILSGCADGLINIMQKCYNSDKQIQGVL